MKLIKMLRNMWDELEAYDHGTVLFFGAACFFIGFITAALLHQN